ncbi:5222_t:CDS:10 [Paraglomus brasilianum]|uniref:5222_t:CDS:1 n=1 Tax=Paraglomus brasilianum TaxID=144538 RepID=A0A9N8ZZC0_9GLOM|nr:5222_t:CDS:10 [Paraglomus brasilianum]
MQRQPKWDIADTNIAYLGSKFDKDARYQASKTEQAWADPNLGIGNVEGLWVWRVEKFEIKPWPRDKYGRFYSGDSYIILHTYKKDPNNEALSHDIHFWLGLDSSQDEIGTAAYKTVELDDFLGTAPVQHREVQGYESRLFLSYFRRLQVEDGGIGSGFHVVEHKSYRHRLLKIKLINRSIVIREVPKDYTSLNSGDVFVLDAGTVLYQLIGKNAQGVEKVKAAEFVQALESERNGLARTIVIDEGDREMPKFWEALGSKGPIKAASEDLDTSVQAQEKRLFRVSDASGELKFTEEAQGRINKSMFDSNDAFVFDAGHEVFVWVGSKATVKERRFALQYAQHYIKQYHRPPYTPITRVIEGGENETFEKSLEIVGQEAI